MRDQDVSKKKQKLGDDVRRSQKSCFGKQASILAMMRISSRVTAVQTNQSAGNRNLNGRDHLARLNNRIHTNSSHR